MVSILPLWDGSDTLSTKTHITYTHAISRIMIVLVCVTKFAFNIKSTVMPSSSVEEHYMSMATLIVKQDDTEIRDR